MISVAEKLRIRGWGISRVPGSIGYSHLPAILAGCQYRQSHDLGGIRDGRIEQVNHTRRLPTSFAASQTPEHCGPPSVLRRGG